MRVCSKCLECEEFLHCKDEDQCKTQSGVYKIGCIVAGV